MTHVVIQLYLLMLKYVMVELLTADVGIEAETFYRESTMSIEVLQGDTLQKIRFWCKDPVGYLFPYVQLT